MYPLGDWTVSSSRERNCFSNGSSTSSRGSNCEGEMRDSIITSDTTENHQQYLRDSLSEDDEIMSDDSGQVDSDEDDSGNRYRKSNLHEKTVSLLRLVTFYIGCNWSCWATIYLYYYIQVRSFIMFNCNND